jgi:acyl-CoA thioesterase-1
VINASRGGKTVTDALKELPGLLASHHPQVVLLELGANDAILGASPAELRQHMLQLIDMAKASGARVALLGFEIPPQLDQKGCARMLHDTYAELAREEHVVLLPSLMAGISDHPALLLDDGVHPTASAQALMLDNAWPTLRPLLLNATTYAATAKSSGPHYHSRRICHASPLPCLPAARPCPAFRVR